MTFSLILKTPRRMSPFLGLALVVALGGLVGPGMAHPARADELFSDELGINVFGFSRHLDVSDGSSLREFNPGAGLQWRFSRSSRAGLDGNLGVYQDSFGHANWHLSLGARVRVLGALSVGAQMINAVSPSLNDGYPVLTPYPIATVSLPRVDLHLTYIPAVRSFNGIATVATFATVYPWGGGDDDDGAAAPRNADRPDESPDWQALEFTVNGLHGLYGLGQGGIMWRHMFDDRRGLRVGVQLAGEVSTTEFEGVSQPAAGNYAGELRLQYLRRAQPHGRLRPYWAAGLAHWFSADSYGTTLNMSLLGNLGVEYTLSPRLSLAVESGLAARYSREHDFDWPEFERRAFQLEAGESRMVLLARRGAATPSGGAAAMQANVNAPAGPALMVLLGGNLTVNPFEGGAIAWRTLDESGRGWRFLAAPQIESQRRSDTVTHGDTFESYGLVVRAAHMRHHIDVDGFGDYWGFGPLVGYEYRHEKRNYDEYPESSRLYRSLSVGLGAVVGAEMPVTAGIRLLAEYSANLLWIRQSRNDGAHRTRWRIENDAVRLGLAVGLGGGPAQTH